ncbi:MAG TPA: NYN domain-containing protein [Acidobacteriaceae bacterium]|nr:NYN domain-containing protein [Acidobacteriaceae bacterium]
MTPKLRTYVYVDGFNLYYRALRKTPYKWLDLEALCRGLLSPENVVERIRYFTAPVGGKLDPAQPIRQQIYLRAISANPIVSIHLGTFLTTNKVRPLAHPAPGGPTHVEILNSEEKGSDVNLASHLIHDACRDRFDVALVLSQDTDLLEPIKIVKIDHAKAVGVVVLDGREPGRLAKSASFKRQITAARLHASQLPDNVLLPNGKTVSRPADW